MYRYIMRFSVASVETFFVNFSVVIIRYLFNFSLQKVFATCSISFSFNKTQRRSKHINSQERFCAHFKSSALGLQPVAFSIIASKIYQNLNFSSGQLSHPVVIQKYVSCGAT